MKKEDLIEDLKNSPLDSFAIFSKGYLEHIDLDQEIFQALLIKLIKESNDLGYINDVVVSNPEYISDDVSGDFKIKADEFYTVVQELCLDDVEDLPYIAKSIRIIRDAMKNEVLDKIKAKIDQGFSFKESVLDGSLEIRNPNGVVIYSSPFISMKEILKTCGIDVDHEQYNLFYFGMIPKEELYQYRLVYSFKSCFQF